jgi:hypothetical protein
MFSNAKLFAAGSILSLCFIQSGFAEEKNPADSASERVPDATVQGNTSDKGPQKYGEKSETSEKSESKAESVGEEKPKHKEKHKEEKEEAKESSESKIPEPKNSAAANPEVVVVTADDLRKEREAARKRLETEENIRAAIRRLCTSGWREAQLQLIDAGKTAMPFLIDALGNTEEDGSPAPAAYQLGGHTKADLGRAPRQRTRAEVCTELLTEIVSHHSNFKGECPTNDQKAWQEWWIANGDKVSFAK